MTVIAYKDFFPAVAKTGGFFTSDEHEQLSATVARANDWAAEKQVEIINIETVVLPNIEKVEEASQTGIHTSGETSSYWFQVVRVWYQTPAPPTGAPNA